MEPLKRNLLASLHALSRLGIEELAYSIQVVDICSEAFQPSEKIRADTLQVTDTTFECVFRIRLQTIQDFHVRSILTDGHDRNETLTVRVTVVVCTDKGVTLLKGILRREAFHAGNEVIELQPV